MARALAKELGYVYVDTGAIYRTVALKTIRCGIAPTDEQAVVQLLADLDVGMAYGENGLQHMYMDGEDVTHAIREHKVSGVASAVSAIGQVRAFLLELQRKMASENNVVMDGRDIGTVVLPDANLKIFLTADAEARAKRRQLELAQRGEAADFETILRDIIKRDEQDSSRAVAPLRQAEDAILLDTTDLNLEESLDALRKLAKEQMK